MENKDSIVKNITRYSSSQVYRRLLRVFSAFIKPKLLTPELLGLWHILNLIPTYSQNAHLGSRTAMRYLLPNYEAKNKTDKILEAKGSTFYGSMYLNIFIAAIIIIISFKKGMSLEVRTGLFTMASIVVLQWYYHYYIGLLKAYHGFKLISVTNYIYANILFFLGIILIYFLNIYGVYLSVVISYIVVIFYIRQNIL